MANQGDGQQGAPDAKQRQLEEYARVDHRGSRLTTDQGVTVDHTDDSLTAGERGPTLLEDFHFREKLTRFDHERIPERVVHARGSGAYGTFEAYEPLTELTSAHFLGEAGRRTPVFVRFSTVAGSRGSADTPRDVRGFATKFYTEEGNFDLVGNNIPIFFIQDGIKFPDFVHAVKPEPHNEIPQAASAHDTLWDFVQLQPETMAMMMWLMSDRAIPRSFRMMQGFGVHTFRLVNAEGTSTFVKFHWRPALGTHSLVWDEAQKIAGKDPDFNRRDLWDAIEAGDFPEWELCIQTVPEGDEHRFDFDLLDPTKIIPEEEVPIRPVGRMILDRNPENFFAETEQVAFCVANLVPGIDVTDDPLMQARMFSYLDTQLIRLGGPNFAELPINRPVAEVHHNQRDGYGQHRIDEGATSYSPNSLNPGGCPVVAGAGAGVFTHFPEQVEGQKLRRRPESFKDYYSQATLFWNSMSDWEREHIVAAFRFELGKVTYPHVKEGVVLHLNRVDHELASLVAAGLGIEVPPEEVPNHGHSSPALSQADQPSSVATRKIAVLVADGVDRTALPTVLDGLAERGAVCELVAPHGGKVATADGGSLDVDRAVATMSSVLYDAVLVADGDASVDALLDDGEAVHYTSEAFKHAKPVGALGAGVRVLEAAPIPGQWLGASGLSSRDGVVTLAAAGQREAEEFVDAFAETVAAHRHWGRQLDAVPA